MMEMTKKEFSIMISIVHSYNVMTYRCHGVWLITALDHKGSRTMN